MGKCTKRNGKRGIRRLTRKQAVVRNGAILLLLLCAMVWILRGYMADGTTEQAVKEWCSANFFGAAEIDGVLTYTEDGTTYQAVFVHKEDQDGDRYEATIFLEKENPLRWISIGSTYSNNPCSYALEDESIREDTTWTGDGVKYIGTFCDLFPELTRAASSAAVILSENERGNRLVQLQVGQLPQAADDAAKTWVDFQVNLDTGACLIEGEPQIVREDEDGNPTGEVGSAGTLWLSEERMQFMAETIYGLLCEKGFAR